MLWWQDLLDSLGLLVLLAMLAVGSLFVRRRLLGRSNGTFECSLRMRPPVRPGAAAAARGWTLGLGRYRDTTVEWFRIFSFSPRPKHTFDRSLTVLSRRTPSGPEAFAMYGGSVVVSVRLRSGQSIEMAMTDSALTGFLAWVEAAPPVHDRIFD
jgi:Protein of unknown function (DUF2550)